MKEIALIYLTLCNGIILLFIGVSTINACYFSALITVMLAYLYVRIPEIKKPILTAISKGIEKININLF
ncbi:hypothetical protein ACFP67_03480 [Mammaliicoccus sciuri]|uniref:hypothetical protein n=1 Tax=Staphylococcaceae TaxID=90964 RepID=UPI000CD2085D|nr:MULTISPECIES: hypothetical protein [Staphylococcaceae]PNZ28661.1 hypothetical protein CD114_03200 [Mammaliicoccus sciuri]